MVTLIGNEDDKRIRSYHFGIKKRIWRMAISYDRCYESVLVSQRNSQEAHPVLGVCVSCLAVARTWCRGT